MNEPDALGQLADVGLVAASMEPWGKTAGHHATHCANCGVLLNGHYCPNCGQRAAVHRSLGHIGEEFFHSFFHFDGKIWRTAPLLFVRPGDLTRRYVHGQRVRFVSPMALFFFSVFLMFFAFASVDPTKMVKTQIPADAKADIQEGLKEAQANLQEAERDAESANAGDDKAEKREAARALKRAQAAVAAATKVAEAAPAADATPSEAPATGQAPDTDQTPAPDIFDWRKTLKELGTSDKVQFTGHPEMAARARASLSDPDLLVYKLKNTASEYSFLLVPMSVPFVWMLFMFRRRVHIYDHVIFVLHSLSFMALFAATWAVLVKFNLEGPFGFWLVLIPPVHLFFHLKGAYTLGVFGAVWRSLFLGIVSIMVLAIYLAFILVLGLIE
jgi:hypothetical protein